MATYWVSVMITERDDCEPFTSKESLGKFVEWKLREGMVIGAEVLTVRNYADYEEAK